MIFNDLLSSIGNTPVIKVNNTAPENINLYVKAEYYNPGGYVKDRLASSINNEAEQNGHLSPNHTIIYAPKRKDGNGHARARERQTKH